MLQELEPIPQPDSERSVKWRSGAAQRELPFPSALYAVQTRRDDEWLSAHVGRVLPDPFETLAARWRAPLHRYCTRRLRSAAEADDAVQEIFVRAYRRLWRTEDAVPQIRPFLFTIARNVCIDRAGAQQRRPEASLEEDWADLELEASERLQSSEELGAVIRDMRALSEHQRLALTLRELSGLSHAEIAERLSTTAARSKSLISEARQVLIERRAGRELDCSKFLVHAATLKYPHLSHRLRGHVESCTRCTLPTSTPPRSLAVLLPVLVGWVRQRMRRALPLAHVGGPAKAVAVLAVLSTTAGITHAIPHTRPTAGLSARSAGARTTVKPATSLRPPARVYARHLRALRFTRARFVLRTAQPAHELSSKTRVGLPSAGPRPAPGGAGGAQPTAPPAPPHAQGAAGAITNAIQNTLQGTGARLKALAPQLPKNIALPPTPLQSTTAPAVAAVNQATNAATKLLQTQPAGDTARP